MGNVRFTFLGPPEVRHADQVLLFSTRKELALLLYLTVEGRVHSRKKLSELFWPEGDVRHAHGLRGGVSGDVATQDHALAQAGAQKLQQGLYFKQIFWRGIL